MEEYGRRIVPARIGDAYRIVYEKLPRGSCRATREWCRIDVVECIRFVP